MDKYRPKKRDKAWRANNNSKSRKENNSDEDVEYLRIQGLVRCSVCMITYPYHFDNCPQCNEKNDW